MKPTFYARGEGVRIDLAYGTVAILFGRRNYAGCDIKHYNDSIFSRATNDKRLLLKEVTKNKNMYENKEKRNLFTQCQLLILNYSTHCER
jgi:hypothetical protein